MTLEMFLTILIVLVVAIIFIKVLRKILSLLICILLIYFIYFNFFTWEGAAKFTTFIETLNKDSYRIEIKEIYHDSKKNEYQIDPVIKSKDEEQVVEFVACKRFGPLKLCEKKDWYYGNKRYKSKTWWKN